MFADKYLNDIDLATDVAQECFIQLWRTNIEFEGMEKVKGFLYTSARNMALNHIKHARVVEGHVQDHTQEYEPDVFFRDQIIEQETYYLVHEAIGKLAEQSRKIILLSLQGYSNQEIADQLHISINSVRTLKQNAYKKLKGLLKEHFYLLPFLLKVHFF